MSEHSDRLVRKLWSYCNVLRDDGLSYQDYLEQLTFLLFLKMADERATILGGEEPVPRGYRWSDLSAPHMVGVKLEEHYRKTLRHLGQQSGMLGLIFGKSQNKIQDSAKLRQLIVELIGKETWLSLSVDVKGDAYEGLLERNAQDTKSGAGQYFTPRSIIDASSTVCSQNLTRLSAIRRAGRVAFCYPPPTTSPTTTTWTETRRSTCATRPSGAWNSWTACLGSAP